MDAETIPGAGADPILALGCCIALPGGLTRLAVKASNDLNVLHR